jgi:FkbM family methyltransferase
MKVFMNFFYVCVVCCSFMQPMYSWETIKGSPPNEQVIERIGSSLSDCPIIVEAGTYNGRDTAALASLLPCAQIFSFEPVPELFQKAKLALDSFENVFLYNAALSSQTGMSELYVSEFKDKPGFPGASSSLLRPTGHLTYAPFVTFNRKIEVSTTTIDDWAKANGISRIDLLKLDIQGNELDVMMASPDLLQSVSAILTEVEFVEAYKGQYLFEDIKAWLEQQGFELDSLFVQCNWFGDALFIRKKI